MVEKEKGKEIEMVNLLKDNFKDNSQPSLFPLVVLNNLNNNLNSNNRDQEWVLQFLDLEWEWVLWVLEDHHHLLDLLDLWE